MKLEVGIGIKEGNIEVGVKINENKSRAEEMYHFEVDCSDLISVRSSSKLGKRRDSSEMPSLLTSSSKLNDGLLRKVLSVLLTDQRGWPLNIFITRHCLVTTVTSRFSSNLVLLAWHLDMFTTCLDRSTRLHTLSCTSLSEAVSLSKDGKVNAAL